MGILGNMTGFAGEPAPTVGDLTGEQFADSDRSCNALFRSGRAQAVAA